MTAVASNLRDVVLSVFVPARNAPELLARCLVSLRRTFEAPGVPSGVEFILLDDASDAGITELFLEFRRAVEGPVVIIRMREHQHYSRACAIGMSIARGAQFLLVSHDMVIAPDYVRTLMQVAALEPAIGIVRGTADYVDCFPNHEIKPPMALRNLNHVLAFSELVASYHGLAHEDDPFLTGDAMLIKRSVLDRIGVMDRRYFGYFGDIDYGLRAQRAGLRLVCAKGAWLHHVGAGYYKEQAARTGEELASIHAARMQVVAAAYSAFRDKWDTSLPPEYPGALHIDFASLRRIEGVPDYEPPIALEDAPCELL